MPTQLELAESARRRAARRAEAFNWLFQHENRPTKDELKELRIKNPGLWNYYPDALVRGG